MQPSIYTVLHHRGDHSTATLDNASDLRMTLDVFRAGQLATDPRLATDQHLVRLDLAVEFGCVLLHQLMPDHLAHAPRRLVCDAQLSLDLLRRDAATSACHQVHRIEPELQRGR